MKTCKFCITGLALGILLCLQDDTFAGDKASELQGVWTVVSYEYRGESQERFIGNKFSFDGQKISVREKDKDSTVRFVLDTTKKPKQIKFSKGDDDRYRTFGIYSVDGDMLKICFSKDGDMEKHRPTEFVAKKDSGLVLMVLKREKK